MKENYTPLSDRLPDKIKQFADGDIYVKQDDLGENFDMLQGLLYRNFATMQNNGIELKITRTKTDEDWEKEIKKMREKRLPEIHIPKPPYPKIPITIKCDNKEDVFKAHIYYLIFQNGGRISFTKSGITASNGACITSKNARNLYADPTFQAQLTSAIQTGDSSALLNLLNQYSKEDLTVNNKHTRENLYRKIQDNATNATTYTKVGEEYNMENFYKNAVDDYNHSKKARQFEIRDCENQSQTGRFYDEYEYDPVNIGVRHPEKVNNALFYQDMYERDQRDLFNQRREYDPELWNYEINFRRPSYFVDYGDYLVPVYQPQL